MNKFLAVFMVSLLPGVAVAADSPTQPHTQSHSHTAHEEHVQAHDEHKGDAHHHEEGLNVGEPGKVADVSRTIDIDMGDNMRFSPDNIEVQAGETIRFVVTNSGQLTHELVIGDMASLQEHAQMMREMPDMAHEEPNMISLAAGEQGEIVWKFTQAGNIDFACLLPGHLEAGMQGQLQVK